MNWTDRMLAGWYVGLSAALLLRSGTVEARYLIQHLVVLGVIFFFAGFSEFGRWWQLAHNWYPTLVFVAAFEEVARLSLVFVPRWQDGLILRAEAAVFPVPPSVWLAQFHGLWLTELLEFGYFTFYWIMFAVGGVLYGRIWKSGLRSWIEESNKPFRAWMDSTVVGYLICYVVFLAFPTEGPAHTLRSATPVAVAGGPFRWLVGLIQHHAGVHGNAFPSGHIMASFVALLAAGRWKPRLVRWLSVPVLLMCVGAVYDGYHYAADIIAGAILGTLVFLAVSAIRKTNRAGVA